MILTFYIDDNVIFGARFAFDFFVFFNIKSVLKIIFSLF